MRRCRTAGLLVLTLFGCDQATPPPSAPASATVPHPVQRAPGAALHGRVVWNGPPPAVSPAKAFRTQPPGLVVITRPSPNCPQIDAASHGIAGAVIALRGVDSAAARPWDHPPLSVELHDERPMVRQGDGPPRTVGFVRRGDAVALVSRQERFHVLRARGAAFWSLTFPDPDRPLTRRFDHDGLVELSSGAGYFWMHGYLFVSDHPYWTLTAPDGQWTLPDVPAGEYELVAWLPSWSVVKIERDPDSGTPARWTMGPPVERVRRVTVGASDCTVPDIRFLH